MKEFNTGIMTMSKNEKALPGANWKGLCEVMNYNEY
jgi:hypothetical protein